MTTSEISQVAVYKAVLLTQLQGNAAYANNMIFSLDSLKKSEQVPFSNDRAMQDELSKTHAMCMKHIETIIAGLQDQIAIIKEYEAKLEHPYDNVKELSDSVSAINLRLCCATKQQELNNIEYEKSLKKLKEFTSVDKLPDFTSLNNGGTMTSEISQVTKMKERLGSVLESVVKPLGTTIRALESIRTERVPRSKDPAFQDELNETHANYIKCIEASITFLNNQIDIEKEFKALVARDNVDQTKLYNSLLEINSRFTLILSQSTHNNTEFERLGNKIAELTSDKNISTTLSPIKA